MRYKKTTTKTPCKICGRLEMVYSYPELWLDEYECWPCKEKRMIELGYIHPIIREDKK
jgi:hypothetical protein